MPDIFQNHTYKAINRSVGKALHAYGMISDGDRILVALSGGKDSLALLFALAERLRRIRIGYTLFPVHIDPGFEGGFADDLGKFVRDTGFQIRIERTDYGIRGHSSENRENPCFLCSRLRRKRLFEIADELGCRKLAFGHHKDDIIETLFLNMCYAGEISTMLPMQPFFKGEFHVIRPLAFVDENLIRKFASRNNFPAFDNPCPSAKVSKRMEIKAMLKKLYASNRKIKGNIFRALSHVRTDYLLK